MTEMQGVEKPVRDRCKAPLSEPVLELSGWRVRCSNVARPGYLFCTHHNDLHDVILMIEWKHDGDVSA